MTRKRASWPSARTRQVSVGGVSLDDKDKVLAEVLLDLSQNAALSASLDVGDKVIGELEDVVRVRRNTVQQAGLLVLKSMDMPSILVETAYISNPNRKKRDLKAIRITRPGWQPLFSAVSAIISIRIRRPIRRSPWMYVATRRAGESCHQSWRHAVRDCRPLQCKYSGDSGGKSTEQRHDKSRPDAVDSDLLRKLILI